MKISRFVGLLALCGALLPVAFGEEPKWLPSTAYAVPKETTSEGSGDFSIIEGKDKKIYVGSAKYGSNAYLVEFDPATKKMGASSSIA